MLSKKASIQSSRCSMRPVMIAAALGSDTDWTAPMPSRPHWNCLAHGKHPPFATLNHAARDSGIPGESATQRVV
jgi:hypothetical protein